MSKNVGRELISVKAIEEALGLTRDITTKMADIVAEFLDDDAEVDDKRYAAAVAGLAASPPRLLR